MPRVGYKSQVLEEVWRVIEDFEIIFQIDLYDDWVWDWIIELCDIYTLVAILGI
ncbi:hypothetical protein L211DRAFT_832998 [Terfezia boudieri ATCC MYA-4762]|uniref:Uncharacterized protein n=1 Tax=Terfezia boudieri ATCC MYA-4762 TaxID=1051890 RepID=A0A3N4M5G3_9PEZI|nr:hypothetical protein L211DRAFT_832998 [Terfezia boudieri ATCC MYA-4762]